jgi:alpha-L-fucosidase 2
MRKFITILCIIHHFAFCLNVKAQDTKLWYTQPAEKWTDALPLGNGRIGAMVFGGVATDRIQFNEESLWTGEPRNYNNPNAYKYLDTIRKLLSIGKQNEAEALAEKEFMGVKSKEGNKLNWIEKIKQDTSYAQLNMNDALWQNIAQPNYNGWETNELPNFDGAVWLRFQFNVNSDFLQKKWVLNLNRISNVDFTYINGHFVGTQNNNDPRKYVVNTNNLREGNNVLAILIFNYFDKGGLLGYKDTTKKIGFYNVNNENDIIPIHGLWKYKIINSEPPKNATYQAAYQPFGDLILNFTNHKNFKNYKRELDLETAECTTTYDHNNITYTRKYIISQPHQVLALHLKASKPKSVSFNVTLTSPHQHYTLVKESNNIISLKVKVNNGVLFGESKIFVRAKNGIIQFVNNKLYIENADEAEVYLTAATNFINYTKVANKVNQKHLLSYKNTFSNSFAQIRNAHIKEYQKYYKTFDLKFENSITDFRTAPTDIRLKNFGTSFDPSFVSLYTQYSRYLLLAASRPGTMAANLQGIWNESTAPPWGSKYTTNINLQMNYWPANILNLPQCNQPLLDLIKDVSTTGKQTAKNYYNADGWAIHHNTDLWRGTAPINAANHGIWNGGSAWLAHHLWEHYLYTQDTSFLKQFAFPIIKEAAKFYITYLYYDESLGYIVSSPTNSPEHGGLVVGATMDHQLIKDLFNNYLQASILLKQNDASFCDLLHSIKANLAPNKIGKFGQLQEWMNDKDDTTNKHRHISHLWEVYPGYNFKNEINENDLRKAAQKSLEYRGDAATGWSLAWKMNCWARFKNKERVFNLVKMLLKPTSGDAGSYNNLFDAHPPFQIDGNFGAAAAVGEMLVQSHLHYIDLLPCLPNELNSGEVKGLCARGGFEIDMKWKNGNLQSVEVLSKVGGTLTLFHNNKYVQMQTKQNEINSFDANLNFISNKNK